MYVGEKGDNLGREEGGGGGWHYSSRGGFLYKVSGE